MDPVSKASFGLNETLRIIIPGYYLLALIYLYLAALDHRLVAAAESFPSIMMGLGLGFILYTWNYPNGRHVYKAGQPSGYLLQRSREAATAHKKPDLELKSDEHIRLYLYILNNFLPQTFHEVVMVRGSLYYCVTYVWVLSGILSVVGFATLLFSGVACLLTGARSLWICGSSVMLDPCRISALTIYSTSQAVIWLILMSSKRIDRTLSFIYNDQIEWLKLNDPLVEYLLVKKVDPRAYGFLKLAPGEQGERDRSS